MRKWFGTDGIRGLANQFLTPELALHLAQASALALNSEEKPLVMIGRDTRLSGPMFESALVAGFCAMGCRVELLGVMPTPAVAWMVKTSKASMGVMISASHNPSPDNGIKLFNGGGQKLSDSIELDIEKYLDRPELLHEHRKTGNEVGYVVDHDSSQVNAYLGMVSQILNEVDVSGLNILLDAGHGATSELALQLFKQLGCQFTLLNQAPNGVNINDQCGSTFIENLKPMMEEGSYDMAFAFDGDGDRCLAMAPNGDIVDGDHIMYLLSQYLPEMEGQSAVVSTVMSNWGFEQALEKKEMSLIRTQVGDRYVLEYMLSHNHFLGGEQSGHVIFSPYQVTGDGLLTAVLCLKALVLSQRTLGDILAELPRIPQILKNVKMSPLNHKSWQNNEAFGQAVYEASEALKGKGRLLVRASGTEPKLRIMAEGTDAKEIEGVVDQLVQLAEASFA